MNILDLGLAFFQLFLLCSVIILSEIFQSVYKLLAHGLTTWDSNGSIRFLDRDFLLLTELIRIWLLLKRVIKGDGSFVG